MDLCSVSNGHLNLKDGGIKMGVILGIVLGKFNGYLFYHYKPMKHETLIGEYMAGLF